MAEVTNRVRLTAGRVAAFSCPPGKSQKFLWDTDVPTLLLRATPTGRKTYAFESRLHGKTLRLSIGTIEAWTLEQAREQARTYSVMIDKGLDPREVEQQQTQETKARQEAAKAQAVTAGVAWNAYIEERKRHWGEHHLGDHVRLARAGGQASARGTRGRGKTSAGPLHPLLVLPLRDLTTSTIETWAAQEGQARPTVARLAWRLLRAFLAWCAEHSDYAAVVPNINPAKTRKARESLGKAGAKQDALLREQLAAWFEAVRALRNPTISAYLQVVLLTGARPGEIQIMEWEDINTQWRGMTIRDKVEGERVIPLTPYIHYLLASLPRRGRHVFASTRAEDAPITEPNHAHDRACKVAGIPHLTLNGLRRSFKSLTEWLEVPADVVAQIQGHKPSATAEKHYTVRPLDLLRLHHERIEAWILEQAKVQFDTQAQPGKLRAV